MLPYNAVSAISFGGIYLPPDDRVSSPLTDYERGGVALLDPSQGSLVRNWKCWLNNADVMLQPEGGDAIVLFSAANITELTICFDQNMRYSVAYIQAGILKLRWYDTIVSAHVVTSFAAAINPKLSLDDKRETQRSRSDMILAYIRDQKLCYRQQRDRFTVERILRSGLYTNTRLKNIGMNKNLRMQFELV